MNKKKSINQINQNQKKILEPLKISTDSHILDSIFYSKRKVILESIYYDRINEIFEIKYVTYFPKGITKESILRKTYHELANKLIKKKKKNIIIDNNQMILKRSLRQWQRKELVMNLFFKALYNFKPSLLEKAEYTKKNESRFSGRYRETKIARKFLEDSPNSFLIYEDNTMRYIYLDSILINNNIDIPCTKAIKAHISSKLKNEFNINIENVAKRFLNLFRESMGKKVYNYEFDIEIENNEFVIDIIQERNVEI